MLAARMADLPEAAQLEAVNRLVEVENRYSIPISLSDEDLAALDVGIAAHARGDALSHAAVMAGLDRIIAG